MKIFEAAWDSLTKEWSPGWRYRAAALPTLGKKDLLGMFNDKPFEEIKDYGQGQTMHWVLPHPNNDNFMVKVPRTLFADTSGFERPMHEPEFDPEERFGSEYYGKNLIQEMEDLGFPVASEHLAGDGYLVQPRLGIDHPDFGKNWNERPRKGVADMLLEHAISDRGSSNWGIDQTGNWRMLDVDLGLGDPSDYWPSSAENIGETLQHGLDKQGIQLPANRLLNFMSNIDHNNESLQHYLETIEPYSDNPDKVEVDGKRPWLEGY